MPVDERRTARQSRIPPCPLLSATGVHRARLQPAAQALSIATCALVLQALLPRPALAQATAVGEPQPARQTYAIPGGALAPALRRLASTANLLVSFTEAQTTGKTTAGINGQYTPEAALAALLADTGLQAVRYDNGGYVLRPAAPASPASPAGQDATTLPTVSVVAPALPSPATDGTTGDGYRASTISSVGALGAMDVRDVPFSVSIVPQELIRNIQAQSPDDIYRLVPSTRTAVPQATGWSPLVSIRGFQTYDTAEDGLRRPYNHAAVIEDKERIEVLNGLSGFLYGAAAPAGMINYVYKRPTLERFNSVTLGNYGGGQYYVHGDFGGRIDPAGRVGYRLNVVRQDGRTAIDDQKIDRTLVSGALDWQLTDRLLLELDATYNRYRTQTPSTFWYFDGVPHGRAPDARRNWSQPWIRDAFDNTRLMSRLTYRLGDQVTFRGAFSRSWIDRPVQDHTTNTVDTVGEYQQLAMRSGHTKNLFDAAQALVDVRFATGTAEHTLTAGYFMYASRDWSTTSNPNTGWTGPYPLSTPARFPEPVFAADTAGPYLAGTTGNRNLVIGDNIRIDERWSVLAGLTHSRITTRDFDATGVRYQADYDKSRVSPSLSVLLRPQPWLTTYASYIEGLEMGGRAPDVASNVGNVMPPMVSRQKELGVKADVRGTLLTAAVFEIEKAYEYLGADDVYTQNGRQRHRGFEFTVTGNVTRALTVLGGLTLLDPAVKGGDFDGKAPINVARVVAKVYAEYALPVPGLTLTGGLYHTGRQWADDANTDRLPSYTTADLGLRYALRAAGRPLTLRLYARNLANRSYWASSNYLGAPRSIAFSAQFQF